LTFLEIYDQLRRVQPLNNTYGEYLIFILITNGYHPLPDEIYRAELCRAPKCALKTPSTIGASGAMSCRAGFAVAHGLYKWRMVRQLSASDINYGRTPN
jgi:hypothetical protein